MKKIVSFIFLLLFTNQLFAQEIKKEYFYKNSNLLVKFKKLDGYKIWIEIFDGKNNKLFNKYIEADYQGYPEINFIDLNNDKEVDIFIKFSGDGEYMPYILISNKNTFIEALPALTFIFDYDTYNAPIKISDIKNEFALKKFEEMKYNSLIFDNLSINGVIYRNVIFDLNEEGLKYHQRECKSDCGRVK
ncbi:MAG: hypothetical protein KU37_04250 [Sulfuricurvum sp. PC08-66]|nr:MAG: hypothetical protein KU37_04250 [Sulfuricurvum sp. PC08-66]